VDDAQKILLTELKTLQEHIDDFEGKRVAIGVGSTASMITMARFILIHV